MAARQLSEFMRHLRRVLDRQDAGGITDGELVKRYVQQRDETAFEALLRRHGPMVFGVCRRVLHNQHDAEDAFQATFLILVSKASSLRSPGMIGNWLYGVAYRTALHAREAAGKRRAKEAEMPAKSPIVEDFWADLRPALDLELERLPDKYRSVIVLCDLEGKTRKEAARHLGLPEGTIASRLMRARTMLAKRLSRHCLAVSGGALAAMLSQNASAGVPTSVLTSTIKAAGAFAAGKAVAAGMISPKVAALTEGVLKTMLLTKLKAATGVCLAISLILMLGSAVGYRTLAADNEPTGKQEGKLRDTLLVLDKQFWEASSKHDLETLNKLIADDYVGLNTDVRWTKKTILQQFRDFHTGDLKLVTGREVTRLTEHAALLAYEAKFKVFTKGGALSDTAHQRLIACWVQRDGGWFVVFSQAADLVGPAPQTKAEAASKSVNHKGEEKKPIAVTPDEAVDQAKREPKKAVTVEFGVGLAGIPTTISNEPSWPLLLEWDGWLKYGGRFYVLLKGKALDHATKKLAMSDSDLAKFLRGKGVRATGYIRSEHETTSQLLPTNYYIIVDDADQFELLK